MQNKQSLFYLLFKNHIHDPPSFGIDHPLHDASTDNPPTPGDARGSAPGKRGVNSNSNNNSSNNGDPLRGETLGSFLAWFST